MVVRNSSRTERKAVAWPLIAAGVFMIVFPSLTQAQTTLFNSNGFEAPTFVTGNLAAYYMGGSGGQQNYLTTDFIQGLGGAAAGTIQTGTVQSGSQAFQVSGPALFDDPTFSGQTFWYRNYPTASAAFNPVGNGNPVVRIAYDQRVTSAPLNLNEMPLVGTYMEGYAASDSSQHALGAVLFNQNGGITAITSGGASGTPLSTAP